MQSPALRIDRQPARPPLPLPLRPPTLVVVAHPSRENRLLRALPPAVLDRIAPHLELITLPQGTVLYESGSLIKHVYFPVNSIISLFYTTENGDSAQTAMVGFEGMVGISPFMGCQTSPSCAVMQTAGSVLKLRASLLADEFENNPQATQILLRYTQSLFIQLAQSAVCNRHHSLEDQLCRWLLTTLDRLPGKEMFMTHDFIANMIGARREGVTAAAGNLQRLGIISYRRGHITIVDRPALERHVCECYAAVRRQTDVLVPARAN
jgi:CRP-like cAMP-binding protein